MDTTTISEYDDLCEFELLSYMCDTRHVIRHVEAEPICGDPSRYGWSTAVIEVHDHVLQATRDYIHINSIVDPSMLDKAKFSEYLNDLFSGC